MSTEPESEPEDSSPKEPKASGAETFLTTKWSVVLQAGGADEEVARAALEVLCNSYWYPIYAFLRRRFRDASDQAADLTQGFFYDLLRRKSFQFADQKRGTFRSFLLKLVQNFCLNELERAKAIKRGGESKPIALDGLSAEERLASEPMDLLTPEKLFDRAWAAALISRARNRMRREYVELGKLGEFEALEPTLTEWGHGTGYAELAARLGKSEGAISVSITRFRARFGVVLREEIAETVGDPSQVLEELRDLFSSVG